VEQIIQASTKIDDVNSIEVGNAVTFNTGNPTSHIGLISSVTRDDAGNVIFIKSFNLDPALVLKKYK
jgi:uncharacterized protein YijF (DUF1287 family)